MRQEKDPFGMMGTIIRGNLWADTGVSGGELVFAERDNTMTAKQAAGMMGLRLVSVSQFEKECTK